VGGPPIVVAPCAKTALQAHPAFATSIQALTDARVAIVDQDTIAQRGDDVLVRFQWANLLAALEQRIESLRAKGT
jgi:hypothetical protein